MMRCRHCGIILNEPRDAAAVRCRSCREPLHEPPGGPSLVRPYETPERGECALHPGNVAMQPCRRCGNNYCPVCRTPWHAQVYCLACVERLVTDTSPAKASQQSHRQQALWGFLLGVLAWALVLGSVALVLVRVEMAPLAVVLLFASVFAALVSVGLGASAAYLRGPRLAMATVGLVLGCAYAGTVIGLVLFSVLRG